MKIQQYPIESMQNRLCDYRASMERSEREGTKCNRAFYDLVRKNINSNWEILTEGAF